MTLWRTKGGAHLAARAALHPGARARDGHGAPLQRARANSYPPGGGQCHRKNVPCYDNIIDFCTFTGQDDTVLRARATRSTRQAPSGNKHGVA